MISARRALLGLLLVFGTVSALGAPDIEITVLPDDDVQSVLDAAPEGAKVTLASGLHAGPLTIETPMELRGEPGAQILAPLEAEAALTVAADGVSVSNVAVMGGWTGIDLVRADDASLSDVTVEGADLQGVRVYGRPAVLNGVVVSGMVDPHAQGIEVLSASDVVVRNSSVTGGKIGIVAHLSEVEFEDNFVTGTGLAGVVIREMSRGTARSNTVQDSSGAGLYCGDMSTCDFRNNIVTGITAADTSRSGAGWGLVVHYRSFASTNGDTLGGAAGEAVVLGDSTMTAGIATRRGLGAGASWPAIAHSGVFVALLALAVVFAGRVALDRRTDRPAMSAALKRAIVPIVVIFLGVQTFHMLEHVIQLNRVHGQGVPGRGGLAGQVVDNELAHFLYNGVVLAGMIGMLWMRRRGWRPDRAALGDRFLVATVLLQGYHMVEHTTKLVQHVVTGAKVSPGILGGKVDLVYLHFGINAAVYLGFATAALIYLRPTLSGTIERWRTWIKVGMASGRPVRR